MRFSLAFAVALAAAGSMTGLARAGSSSAPLPSAEAFAGVQSLDNRVLRLALGAVACARSSGQVRNDRLLTVIDYSKAADTHVGGNGYSHRLYGLEAGFNDRARERAIVMHGAPYVSDDNVRAVGRLGRSHGCPALRPSIARSVIDTIKQGSLVFAYYPDKHWLQGSRFLNGCS